MYQDVNLLGPAIPCLRLQVGCKAKRGAQPATYWDCYAQVLDFAVVLTVDWHGLRLHMQGVSALIANRWVWFSIISPFHCFRFNLVKRMWQTGVIFRSLSRWASCAEKKLWLWGAPANKNHDQSLGHLDPTFELEWVIAGTMCARIG